MAPEDGELPSPWFPVAFSRDLAEEPHRITVHGRGYVLFRTGAGWQALRDRCPHRAARLSDGTIRDGRLECLYHGWQFGEAGRCLHIPQLLATQKIPAKAHVDAFPVEERQGIVWLCTEPAAAAESKPPIVEALDASDRTTIDFMIDLPYAQSFLIENVIDIAHIHVAHHGVRGGGHREMAAPLEFELGERSAAGFTAHFRSVGIEASDSLRGARVSFVAPNLVHYESIYQDTELRSGLALYSAPLAADQCRLLYRAYNNFPRLRDRLRPRWLEHWTQCTILEQDMDIVQGQVEEMLGSGQPARAIWLPLKSSDALVIAYRKWLDEHTDEGPLGFDRPCDHGQSRGEPKPFDRLEMHTRICSSCSRVHRRLLGARTPLTVMAFLLLALAASGGSLLTQGLPQLMTLALALAAGAARLVVDQLEKRFRGRA